MATDTLIREAFEKWVLSASTPEENLLERLPNSSQGDYRWQVVNTGWMAWHAAWLSALQQREIRFTDDRRTNRRRNAVKTQKVRIKVLIDGVGHYCGYGWDGATSKAIDETIYEVVDGPAMKEYWLEAEVPIPEIAPEIIQATVLTDVCR